MPMFLLVIGWPRGLAQEVLIRARAKTAYQAQPRAPAIHAA
jgi:hypothetical protein